MNVDYRVLDAGSPEDLRTWLALWHAWPGREVSAHPEYARLFARPCDRVVCATGVGPDRTVLFPVLLRPIAAEPWADPGDRRVDAITPYGYGGPFAWGEGRDDGAFWTPYQAWCRDERVVTTFARLSLFEEQLARFPVPPEVRGANIAVPLSGGGDALWRGYEGRVRRWIQVAERAGLQVTIDRDGSRLGAFLDIYAHTMRRREADPWYLFPRSFFEAIVVRLPGRYAFVHVHQGDRIISSDLVLVSEEHTYYFLGGTLEDAFPLGPNYLLKHHAALWAAGQGKRTYVLGGGKEEHDGLFRYKRGFGRSGEVPFKVVGLVHDEGACAELASRRAASEARAGRAWAARQGFFPIYRS